MEDMQTQPIEIDFDLPPAEDRPRRTTSSVEDAPENKKSCSQEIADNDEKIESSQMVKSYTHTIHRLKIDNLDVKSIKKVNFDEVIIIMYEMPAEKISFRVKSLDDKRSDHEQDGEFVNLLPVLYKVRHEFHCQKSVVTSTRIENDKRVTTVVTTIPLIHSSHPLEQAWLDKSAWENADTLFDMSRCVGTCIAATFTPLENVFIAVKITDGPVTTNMLYSALESVLEQELSVEMRALLWKEAKKTGKLRYFSEDFWYCRDYGDDGFDSFTTSSEPAFDEEPEEFILGHFINRRDVVIDDKRMDFPKILSKCLDSPMVLTHQEYYCHTW